MRVGTPVKAAVCTLLLLPAFGMQGAQAAVEVPPGYQVLAPAAPDSPVSRQRLSNRLDPAWGASALGADKGLAIDALGSEPRLEADRDADVPRMPASTTKLLTATAALDVFGPDHRFKTTVVRDANTVVLVGGGDPQLTSLPAPRSINANASLIRLASQTADALTADGVTQVTLGYDASLFGAPAQPSFWDKDYPEIGVVAPVTALMTDAGRANPPAYSRSTDPAKTTAQQFARLLGDRGIVVSGQPVAMKAAGKKIAQVESPTLANLVEHMLLVSDNTEADVLAHQVGLKVLKDPTFAGGAEATLQVLSDLGIDTDGIVLNDGSGLARANRISPDQLVSVLRTDIEDEPEKLWPVYTGLPVAAFDGSLTNRFRNPSASAGRGTVTGKTGTLTGTSALAGLLTDRDGQVMLYALMTNNISVWGATEAIDKVVAQAAACRCASPSASPSPS